MTGSLHTRLDELYQRATSGPWEHYDYDPNDHGDDNAAAIIGAGAYLEDKDCYAVQHKMEILEAGVLFPEDEQWDEAQANAALIVMLHNAWPAISDALAAAQALAYKPMPMSSDERGEWRVLSEQLRQTLTALSEQS